MSEKTALRIVTQAILLIACLIALAWFAWMVRSVLILIVVSIVLATGISPIVDAIAGRSPERQRFRLPRSGALLLLYIGLFMVATLATAKVVPNLIAQAEDFGAKLPTYAGQIQQSLRDLEAASPLFAGAEERLMAQVGETLNSLSDVSSRVSELMWLAVGVMNGVLMALLLLVFTFYLIVDAETLSRGALSLLPAQSRETVSEVAGRVRTKIGNWLIGQLVLSLSVGTATFIGLSLLGVPYPLFLSSVAAVGELIPMVGPILAAIPAVLVAVQINPTLGLLTVVLYVAIQQLENHVLVPQVMRRAVDLPPVVVMAALLMGNEVLGVVGAILALPVAAAASVVVGEVLKLRDKPEEISPEADFATPSRDTIV